MSDRGSARERLGPPDVAATSDETRDLLALAARHGRPPATIEMFAHEPALLAPFLGWAAALALSGALPAREHEILALRVAHLCGSAFELTEHTTFAVEAGLSREEIAAIEVGDSDASWNDGDRALLVAVDELHRDGSVSDATYGALAERHEPGALVDIPLIVGQYTMLSMLTGFFAIPGRG